MTKTGTTDENGNITLGTGYYPISVVCNKGGYYVKRFWINVYNIWYTRIVSVNDDSVLKNTQVELLIAYRN